MRQQIVYGVGVVDSSALFRTIIFSYTVPCSCPPLNMMIYKLSEDAN